MGASSASSENPDAPAKGRRLESWKAIAAYLKRTVRTVHRWEKEEGLPVHRHLHKKQGTVYAYTAEIDTWWRNRGPPERTAQRPHWHWRVLSAAAVLAAAVLSVAIYWLAAPPARDAIPHSIAVLPFEALTTSADDELLAYGIADELRGRLAAEPSLNVTGRESAFAFAEPGLDPVDIARRLGVEYLLMGNLQRADGAVRVRARLLDASGLQIWSASYDRTAEGLFDLQDEIATTVFTSIAPRLEFLDPPAERPDPDAYYDYLLGREYLRRLELDAALAAFERAVRQDPLFSGPHGGIALVRAVQVHSFHDHVSLAQAREAAVAALELEPVEARAALGRIAHVSGELMDAEISLRSALEVDPNLIDARIWLADNLLEQGRYEESRRQLESALELDPLHPRLTLGLAGLHWSSGDYEAARQRFLRLFDLPHPPSRAYREFVRLHRGFGRLQEALEWAKRGALAHPTEQDSIDELVLSYLRLGMLEDAERWRQRRPWLGVNSEFLYTLGRFDEVHALNMEYVEAAPLALEDLPRVLRLATGGFQILTERLDEGIAVLEAVFANPFRIPQGVGVPGHRGDFDIMFAQFLALGYRRVGRAEEAAGVLDRIAEYIGNLRRAGLGGWPNLYIAEARNHALRGESSAAVAALREAVHRGWRDYAFERHNPCWEALRGRADYEALIATVERDVAAQYEHFRATARDPTFEARLLAMLGN